MTVSKCKHQSGDFIQGMWVCAHCYRPLDGRPKTYGLGIGHKVKRQEILWMAEIATSGGVPFRRFVGWMVRYLRMRCLFTMSKHEALSQCLEALRDMGEPYGDDGATWDRDDAKEIVNEAICAYWDEVPSGSNA